MPKNDQIYSVTMTWYMKSEQKWTHPCIIDYLKIEDGDLERVSHIIAKDYGGLEEGWLQVKDGIVRFGIESDTFYRFTISPIIVRDM